MRRYFPLQIVKLDSNCKCVRRVCQCCCVYAARMGMFVCVRASGRARAWHLMHLYPGAQSRAQLPLALNPLRSPLQARADV